jgi:hypothetical protein
MGAVKRSYDHLNATAVSAGTANVQTLTYTVAPTAYVAGDCYAFRVGLTNTGATTLNVNGLGAKNVLIGASALAGGELQIGQVAVVHYDGTSFQLVHAQKPASAGFAVSNPVGVAGAAVMMGIGGACTITPTVSGEIGIWLTGDIGTGTTAGTVIRVQLYFGTVTAPTNGAAVTGTATGSSINFTMTGYTANDRYPFSAYAHVTALTAGVAYWIDISLSATTGTATAQNMEMIVRETPR